MENGNSGSGSRGFGYDLRLGLRGQRMGFSPACMERLSRDQLGDKRPNRIKRAGICVECTVFGVEAI